MVKDLNKPDISTEIHLQSQEQKNDFEKSIQFDESWTVTLPEVILSNPFEALRFVRNQERKILSKMRESNKYVIDEVKEMLELLFNRWSGKKVVDWYADNSYETSKWHQYANYEEYQRWCFVFEPIEFLENHEWSLSNFMDMLEKELKEEWILQRYNPQYINNNTQNKLNELRWKSIKELRWMDLSNISFVEIFKEEIKNLSKMPESESEYFYHLKFNYMWYIIGICEKLWYKRW